MSSFAAAARNLGSTSGISDITKQLGEADKAAKGLSLSFGGFTQMIASRLASKALFEIIGLMKRAAQAAMDLSTQTAKMGTFAGGRRPDDMAKPIIGYSSQMNVGLTETTAGYQQSLKSGFEGSADTTKLMDASMNLAKATLTELAPAVDLVAGSLRAYGQSAEQADMVSSRLDAIAKLSKVNLSDLSGSFARSEMMGAQLGISMNELGAYMTTLAQNSLKPSDAAQTLFQNLRNLITPTAGMSQALKRLNLDTAEQGIATLGFGGFLEKLAGTTDGTIEGFSKLQCAGRGVNGIMEIGSVAIDQYNKNLETLNATERSGARKDADKVLESNGQVIGRALQRAGNAFVDDNPIIKWTADLLRAKEGTHQLKAAFDGFIGGVESAGIAVAGVWAASWLTSIGAVEAGLAAVGLSAASTMTAAAAVMPVVAIGTLAFLAARSIDKNTNAELEARQKGDADFLHMRQDTLAKIEQAESAANQSASSKCWRPARTPTKPTKARRTPPVKRLPTPRRSSPSI